MKATVETDIENRFETLKPPPKSAKKAASAVKKATKKMSTDSSDTSVILAPPSAVRQSTRKRVPKSYEGKSHKTIRCERKSRLRGLSVRY